MCARILVLLEKHEESHQVHRCLVLAGHQVVLTSTFDEAIAVLREKQFNLIISEVHLENGGSVFDFLRWVRTHRAIGEIPFVLLTTKSTQIGKYLEDGVRTTARMLGASRFIVMDSFNANEFRKQIDSLISKTDATTNLESLGSSDTAKEIGG